MNLLAYQDDGPAFAPISPYIEMGAYEALWLEKGATFKSIAENFASDPTALPSDLVPKDQAQECATKVFEKLKQSGVDRFGVRIHHAGDYPDHLRDAKHPVELLYYRGTWELAEAPSVSIVGSRKASADGVARAHRLARVFAERGYVIVSGLATGIDTAAHTGAIEVGGETIAVVGTPLGEVYPKENTALQEKIANDFLLISQVPVLRYGVQNLRGNRLFRAYPVDADTYQG